MRSALDAFRAGRDATPAMEGRFAIYGYARREASLDVRIFAPLSGTPEDPATGSAAAPLACLLLSLEPPTVGRANFNVTQGVAVGRPSVLHVRAERTSVGIVASVRGACVDVMQGVVTL